MILNLINKTTKCLTLFILSSYMIFFSLCLSNVVFLAQIKVSSAVLKAAAHHYGSQCDKPNKEFMLCRWEEKDPRKCLEEGRQVNECALNFFRYPSAAPVPRRSSLSGRCYYFIFSLNV